jgi:LPXTG-motif cell wall-anchored protein
MTTTIRRILTGLCTTATVVTSLSALVMAQKPMPKTTTERIAGDATVNTQVMKGTVVEVDGKDLLVRMNSGDLREFTVPDSRKFTIDGKELSVQDLKPGTRLTATVTTTTTPVTERTTTIGTGKVFYVSGRSVILTLPNNENRMYKVEESYRFNVDGRKATVHDLRKGMVISAEKIVESPKTEIASDTVVTGHAPPEPKPIVAENTAPAAPAPAPAPAREAAAPAPAPAPAEVAEAKPATLPKTGSELPLAGMLGLLFTGASFYIRKLRRS